jgi:biotin operon repressor
MTMQPTFIDTVPRHDGPDLAPADQIRLANHLQKLVTLMSDGRFRSLQTIADALGCSESAAGARVRDLKKRKFGSFTVEKRRQSTGYVYRVQA